MALAFKAAGSEPGKGVKRTKVVERVGDEGLAQDITTDFGDSCADLSSGDLLRGLETADRTGAVDEFEGTVAAEAALFDEALLAQIVLITAGFPPSDVLLVQVLAELAELLDDLGIAEPVIEHVVYALAHFFGQTGDCAGALT